MPFCTGQGIDDIGGCCHLGDGSICPHYKTAAEAQAWVETQGWKGQTLSRARDQAEGPGHRCDIAIQVIATNAGTINDRALFEQLWHDHPQYQADVRPWWIEHEQRNGLAPDSYNCPTWQSSLAASPTCCWAQDESTCDAQATALHSTAVTIRRAGGR